MLVASLGSLHGLGRYRLKGETSKQPGRGPKLQDCPHHPVTEDG